MNLGGGIATGEHDEAECEVLLLGGWVVGALGALTLRPGLHEAGGAGYLVHELERGSGCCRGVQSFQGHEVVLGFEECVKVE